MSDKGKAGDEIQSSREEQMHDQDFIIVIPPNNISKDSYLSPSLSYQDKIEQTSLPHESTPMSIDIAHHDSPEVPRLSPTLSYHEIKRENEVEQQSTPLKWPIFIMLIMLLNWIFFMWGIVFIIGYSNSNLSLSEPTSPPVSTFFFLTVNIWPSCSDARGNTWRLVSSQFTHTGLSHIGGNTIAGLFYGAILESSHPYHWFVTIIVYEVACIMGCLGHSYVWPFEGLVGCSTGVYGLIGCCFASVILNKDTTSKFVYYGLLAALLFQIPFDTFSYFFDYSKNVAHMAHVSGLFTGVFIGFSFGMLQKPIWKRVLGILGLILFCLFDGFLIFHYLTSWPPQMRSYNPTFKPYNRQSCCGELYSQVNETFPLSEARNRFTCKSDGSIVFR
jgi:membrane associated rhomboid family serine protease